ncbi:D-tyrosyl-tRNAtyr deacylase [Nitzschia inconspicua]|uniref:D-tyrosyl-tRNAtyr deacylase n=1 Tax=Nitzschia inconspicua TaxID=303405 RepID=A0A9K3PND1_9STRA|nr:D-tyrosyl-tRNAtyr deacylase [Nitzschia inconspicua]
MTSKLNDNRNSISCCNKGKGDTIVTEEQSSLLLSSSSGTVPITVSSSSSSSSSSSTPSIRMVVQRYRKATILIDERTIVSLGEVPNESTNGKLLLSETDSAEFTISNTTSTTPSSSLSPSRSAVFSSIGMLVYISFSKTATRALVEQAARTILQLPIQTTGVWGDGTSTTQSLLEVLLQRSQIQTDSVKPNHNATAVQTTTNTNNNNNNNNNKISLLLVPQANLIAKVKKNGKSIQYHDQIDKDSGKRLYELFCQIVESLLIQHQQFCRRNNIVTDDDDDDQHHQEQHHQKGSFIVSSASSSSSTTDPSIPPSQLFRDGSNHNNQQYGTFDETTGLPLTNMDGTVLTKSARKKIQKIYDAHTKRHQKWLNKQQQSHHEPNGTTTGDKNNRSSEETNNITLTLESGTKDVGKIAKDDDDNDEKNITAVLPNVPTLDPNFVHLVAGSFGKRQGLEMVSDMGPFCHVIEI